jgi:hypothetical protein
MSNRASSSAKTHPAARSLLTTPDTGSGEGESDMEAVNLPDSGLR